jgi:hypothetical protein
VKQHQKHERRIIMKKLIAVLIFSLFGSALFAQTDLAGNWDTGMENTLVKIFEKKGVYFGEIVSSDNPEAEIGKQLIKDLMHENGKWKGKLYAVKKKKWVNAVVELEDGHMKITIKAGFKKKTIEWNKVELNSDFLNYKFQN